MVHCRFTINRQIDQQHCVFRSSQDMGNRKITFISGEQGNKCPKGRGTGKQIKFRGTGNIGILVKHGNHLCQNNRGTGNSLEEPHFQGKMKGSKLL